jgi:uncharacterized membrane protein YfcA
MHPNTRLVAAAAMGAMAGACAGIELAMRLRQPDTRWLFALFAIAFAVLGGAIGGILQMAVARPRPVEATLDDGE